MEPAKKTYEISYEVRRSGAIGTFEPAPRMRKEVPAGEAAVLAALEMVRADLSRDGWETRFPAYVAEIMPSGTPRRIWAGQR